jgi:hypothetical protein
VRQPGLKEVRLQPTISLYHFSLRMSVPKSETPAREQAQQVSLAESQLGGEPDSRQSTIPLPIGERR